MLPSTEEEQQHVISYMHSQAPDLEVVFLQKVYEENVLSHKHCVWDVHTNVDRWWVITNPTNLYSQDQFPNMDLAVTFHVGLCLRMPRSDRTMSEGVMIAPLADCFHLVSEAQDALLQANDVSAYQAIGVRCREALLKFTDSAQLLIPWKQPDEPPKNADFKAWIDHVLSSTMAGEAHKNRRQLFRPLLEGAWNFSNWLTHSKSSTWFDAETAVSTVEHAISLAASSLVRYVRNVPEICPICGSHGISPQRGFHSELPDIEWERPACEECEWTGYPVPILDSPEDYADQDERNLDDTPHILSTIPLRKLHKPQS